MSKTLLFSTTLLCLSLSFHSCTTLLQANFEADALGADPNKSLPGSPNGDDLNYIAQIENRLNIIRWETSNALEISNFAPTGDSPDIIATETTFFSREGSFSNPINYAWNGQFNSNMGMSLLINLGVLSGTRKNMTSLRLSPEGQLFYFRSSQEEEALTTIETGNPHTFIISFDRNTRLFDLEIIQTSGSEIFRNLPFSQGSGPFPPTGRFLIIFDFERPSSGSVRSFPGHNYVLDNLSVSQRNP